jgi:hypothetical protein
VTKDPAGVRAPDRHDVSHDKKTETEERGGEEAAVASDGKTNVEVATEIEMEEDVKVDGTAETEIATMTSSDARHHEDPAMTEIEPQGGSEMMSRPEDLLRGLQIHLRWRG